MKDEEQRFNVSKELKSLCGANIPNQNYLGKFKGSI